MKRPAKRSARVKHPPAPQPGAAPGIALRALAPSDPGGDERQRAETQKALRGLPAHLRKVLVLREVDRLPMDEVAARLGVTRAAAERRWARAVELMTQRLAKRRPKKPGV